MANYYLTPITTILQYFTDSGVVLNGGKVFTYLAGTSTAQQTKTDSTGSVNNANPIILNAAGRLNNVNIWQLQGIKLKIIIQDASGNQIGPVMDQIAGINDPTDLLASLSAPASGSGVDLIANAMRSYDLVSSVRASNTPVLSAGQTLVIDIEALTTPGDNLGGLFYWDSASTLTDDGVSVIKLTAATTGRYIRQNQTPLGTTTQNGAYTFVAADGFRQVLHTDSTTYQYNIPPDSVTNFPIGTILTVVNQGSGSITVAGNGPPIIESWSNAGTGSTIVQGFMTSRFIKTVANTWQQMDNTLTPVLQSIFVCTLTGCTAGVTGNIGYYLLGNSVVLYLLDANPVTGISNTTAFSFTGLPASIRPITKRVVPCLLTDNSASTLGFALLDPSTGTVIFGAGTTNNTGGFTASNNKGLPTGWQLTYKP